MRICSFLGDQVPSLYFVPSTLDLLRRCLRFPALGDGSPSPTGFRCWRDGGLPGQFVAPAELVRGGIGLGGWKFGFMVGRADKNEVGGLEGPRSGVQHDIRHPRRKGP